MTLKSFALGGAAIVALATVTLSPAYAFTHHPATPEEQRQTDDLNAQQLAKAQSQSDATQATTTAIPAPQAAESAAPVQQSAANAVPGESTKLATASASGQVTLDAVANPPQTLTNASVESANGQAVGAVQKVVTGADGKAQIVDVALLGAETKIVAIDAAQLTYDQSRNVVVAQLSADQIQALPPAPQG